MFDTIATPSVKFVSFMLLSLFITLLSGCNKQSEDASNAIATAELNYADLTKKTTLEFAQAIKAGDLALFRNKTADEFKKKFSLQQFNNAFGGFISQNINMMAVQSQLPLFEQTPTINEAGNLVARGYFPTSPSRVWFNYTYKKDPLEWKIIGIDIKVIPQT